LTLQIYDVLCLGMPFHRSSRLFLAGRLIAGELALRSCLSNVRLFPTPEQTDLPIPEFPSHKLEFGIKHPVKPADAPFWKKDSYLRTLRKPDSKLRHHGARPVNRGRN
jgi:hypothetical protein